MSEEAKPKGDIAAWFFSGVQSGATCKVTNPDGSEPQIICNIGALWDTRELTLPKASFMQQYGDPIMSVVYNFMRDKFGIK